MSANKPKQASRWGNLLSGAVAGLESRLDTILAEDGAASARSREAEKQLQDAKAAEAAAKGGNLEVPGSASTDSSRSASRTRVNDRLAERLAKAVADKKGGSQTPSEAPSRVGSPAITEPRSSVSSRLSMDISRSVPETQETAAEQGQTKEQDNGTDAGLESSDPPSMETSSLLTSGLPINPARVSVDSQTRSVIGEQEEEAPSVDVEEEIVNGHAPPTKTQAELEAEIAQMQAEYMEAEKHRQEEMHANLERIDALQAKLQYLAKETVAAAREANAAAGGGSLEQKMAEKDERIALLMQEGEKLSKTELRHMGTIKKLRAKASEEEKAATELRKKLSRAEQAESDLKGKLRHAESAQRQASERLKRIPSLERELTSLRAELDSAKSTISMLRSRIVEAEKRAEEAERRAQATAAESDSKKVASLQEELENAKIEKKLAQDRANAEIRKINEEVERQKEKANAREMELTGEISNLESRMEALRARAEEASSDVAGDSQAKLLRQVETLQTQYSLAAENWRTIESSLNARLAALEKERDEATKREADVRKRARDISNKSRRIEEDLESANSQAATLSQGLETQQVEFKKLQQRLQTSEAALTDTKADFERQRKIWESELQQRIEEERTRWTLSVRTAESPSSAARKPSTPDNLHVRRTNQRLSSHDLSSYNLARRPSGIPSLRSPLGTPDFTTSPPVSRQESLVSLSHLNGLPPMTPSIQTENADEDFEGRSSPQQTLADVLSASTVHTGPSVALVERMSASIRRLESEKAAHKDELARLLAQRDEARDEVVSLMREVEAKRTADADVGGLRKELEQVKGRYEACLEMLGEKEEEVEELKGDVADLKRIYRELAEKMGR